MRPEQLLYRHAAAERMVSGVSPTATSQVQKRLDRFPADGSENKNETISHARDYYFLRVPRSVKRIIIIMIQITVLVTVADPKIMRGG